MRWDSGSTWGKINNNINNKCPAIQKRKGSSSEHLALGKQGDPL